MTTATLLVVAWLIISSICTFKVMGDLVAKLFKKLAKPKPAAPTVPEVAPDDGQAV